MKPIDILCCAVLGAVFAATCAASDLPQDVRSNHWAASAVQEVLDNHVMSLPDGRSFHGEATVTHAQAAIAIAKLAQSLEAGTWKGHGSVPVPQSSAASMRSTAWTHQPLTRYAVAGALARIADYVTNGIQRPGPNPKDLAKSEALPAKAAVKVPPSNPAYSSLTYLAKERMVWPNSPLLKADSKPIRGAEMSLVVAQMVTGLNDRLTELGLDAEGDTPDATFQKKKPAPGGSGSH